MSSEQMTIVVAVVEGFVFMLPLFRLIWNASKMNSRIEQVENENKKLSSKLEDLDNATDQSLATIINALNDIKVSIAKLETRFDDLEEKTK